MPEPILVAVAWPYANREKNPVLPTCLPLKIILAR